METTTRTTRDEIRVLQEQAAKRRAEKVAHAAEVLRREFPDMIIDESKIYAESFGDVFYFPDNLTYYTVPSYSDHAFQQDTDLGYYVNDAKQSDRAFQLLDMGYTTVMVEAFVGNSVWVHFFTTDRGSRRKGKKGIREAKASTKGAYLTLYGRRYYINEGLVTA